MDTLQKRLSKADLAFLLLLALLFLVYTYNLTGWKIFDDEGEYLYQVWRMVTAGEAPYRDFLTPQLPVFLYAGAGVMQLGGISLEVMRLYSVAMAFATAIVLYLAGKRHRGFAAGLLAALIFLVHPDVFRETRIFRNEPLFILLVTLALVISTWSRNAPQRRNLAIAGILYSLATFVKLFGILPAAGTGLWLVWDWFQYRRPTRAAVSNILALILPMALTGGLIAVGFLLIAPNFLELVLGHHLAQGSDLSLLRVLLNKLRLYAEYVSFYPVLIAISFLSVIMAVRQRDVRMRWVWQLPTVAAFLVISRQFGQRHFMYLLPTFSLLAGWLLADFLRDRQRYWLALMASILFVLYAVPAARTNADRASWVDTETDILVNLIQERTPPGEAILADDIGLAYYARRPTTYSGAALSHGAVTSGQITGEILIDEIVAGNVRMVLVDVSLLTGNHIVFLRDYPRFHRFLEDNFQSLGRIHRDYQEIVVWWRDATQAFELNDDYEIGVSDGTQFGQFSYLLGYTLEDQSLIPGEILHFTLFWEAHGPADNYWSVFTHLIGPDGALVAQDDQIPYEGVYPPDRWWPGQIVDDDFAIQIPESAPAGDYYLQVGMYDFQTGERLPLFSPGGEPIPDNLIRLHTPIRIQP